MPRIGRMVFDGLTYHIINRGNARTKVFRKEWDYRAFTQLMKRAKELHPVKLFAYCLMPNHFHMVLSPVNAEDLGKWVHWLMTSHVRRYHEHYRTSGHIWQGRFKSFIVQENEYLLTLMKYVEGNPVRAGLVQSARDWKWSSHRESLGEKDRELIDECPVVLPKKWAEIVNEPMPKDELGQVRSSVNRQVPYGKPNWEEELSEMAEKGSVNP